jgi:hypothetical protein
MKKARALIGGVVAAAAIAMGGVAAAPANAAGPSISVTFGDWRCAATGGGSVVAVQMGSQYGYAPATRGRTISIGARVGAANHLTGVIWCKRPWYRGGFTTPVYNISQGVWVSYNGQRFNV